MKHLMSMTIIASALIIQGETNEEMLSTTNVGGGVQLWEGGPYWAECNVGATKPEEFGYYFWWGDTMGYKRMENHWVSINGEEKKLPFTIAECLTCGKSNLSLRDAGYIDSTGNLLPTYDVATVYLGKPWRMPTAAEFLDLTNTNKCDAVWTTRNGVYGKLVTGRGAYSSKSIFLPAAGCGFCDLRLGLCGTGSAGYYWSSTLALNSSDSIGAWYLAFTSGKACGKYYPHNFCLRYFYRYNGQPVRPVR